MDTKQLAYRWFEGVWNQKDPSVIAAMMHESAEGVSEAGPVRGPAGFRAAVFDPFVHAFPDVRVTVDGVVAEGDEAAIRWTATGTHGGQLGPLAATGKGVRFSGITWLKFQDGKIIAGTDSYNLHGLVGYLSGGATCASVRSLE